MCMRFSLLAFVRVKTPGFVLLFSFLMFLCFLVVVLSCFVFQMGEGKEGVGGGG